MSNHEICDSLQQIYERYANTQAAQANLMFGARPPISDRIKAGHDLLRRLEATQDVVTSAEVWTLTDPEGLTYPGDRSTGGTPITEQDRKEQAQTIRRLLGSFELHEDILEQMALVYAYSLWDALFADLLLAILCHRPAMLESNRSITYVDALAFSSRDDLILGLAQREIRVVMGGSLEEQFKYLKSKFGIDFFAQTHEGLQMPRLTDIRDRRNLVVHNGSRVDRAYGAKSRTAVGSRLVFERASSQNDRYYLAELSSYLHTALRATLKCIEPGC